MYRINQIKLGLEEETSAIPRKILNKLTKNDISVVDYKIVRESIDARDKGDLKLVYTVDFSTDKDISDLMEKIGITEAPDSEYHYVEKGVENLKNRPIIAGFGPCGMFAALVLSEMGYKPIVLERGKCIADRVADVENFWNQGILNEDSNVQFGEGGAGTFSDGKLTTQIKDKRISKVLQALVEAGADSEILYKQKPHIGTDVLRKVVTNIRKRIEELGGEICFQTKLTDIRLEEGAICGIQINDEKWLSTENLILALGHSARDTFRLLHERGLYMEQKPFSIGVRISHRQALIDKAQYGGTVKKLGAADYKLAHRCGNGRGVYTFCMCPGGEVIVASSQSESVVTNGMSYHARDGKFANSALLVDVRTSDFESSHPLAGISFQEKYEKLAYVEGGKNYRAPSATWKEFTSNTASGSKVRGSIPEFAVEAILEAMPYLGRKLRGFDSPEAILTAVEARSSSPVRLLRNEYFESSIQGVFPGGEGAGYAGGITSAAVDGIRLAEQIALRYKPFENEQQI